MAVQKTKAALIMEAQAADMTAHQVISLLLEGALERVGQAKYCISSGNTEDKALLFGKIIAIINGLRNSLDLAAGGEIAQNLDGLYDYMANRVGDAATTEEYAVMNEIEALLLEIKCGWDDIAMGQQQEKMTA
ncbi:MAG: flagellar export chaperone FliS [Alteromonadaceae bacterium]|nr:MAG: flagellar export chaperone FliS [Alteromonadaceae bacterium]